MKKRMSMARRKMSHVIDEVYTALFLAGGKEVDLRIVKEEEGLRLLVRGDFAPDHRKKIEGLTKSHSLPVTAEDLEDALRDLQ